MAHVTRAEHSPRNGSAAGAVQHLTEDHMSCILCQPSADTPSAIAASLCDRCTARGDACWAYRSWLMLTTLHAQAGTVPELTRPAATSTNSLPRHRPANKSHDCAF